MFSFSQKHVAKNKKFSSENLKAKAIKNFQKKKVYLHLFFLVFIFLIFIDFLLSTKKNFFG